MRELMVDTWKYPNSYLLADTGLSKIQDKIRYIPGLDGYKWECVIYPWSNDMSREVGGLIDGSRGIKSSRSS